MTDLIRHLNNLLTVQEVDSRLDRLKADLAAIDNGSRVAAAYNSLKTEFDALKATALKAQANQQDAELRLKSIEEKSTQVTKTLYGGGVSASRELENLQRELDMLARQKADAEVKVLEAMDAAADALNTAHTTEARLLSLAEKYKRLRAAYKEKQAEVAKEMSAIEAERVEAVKPIPPALLSRYDTTRAKRGGIGVAPLNDNICGGCQTKLNTNLVHDVREGKKEQLCEYCGRLLVPPLPASG
jgi:predicted  nucleic acid-binding Zn-ribbon protein